MGETDHAMAVNDRDQRHPSKLEYIDLLLVTRSHRVPRIGQTNKRELLRAPIQAEGGSRVGTDCDHLCPAAGELVITVPQARQLRAAVRSQKAA